MKLYSKNCLTPKEVRAFHRMVELERAMYKSSNPTQLETLFNQAKKVFDYNFFAEYMSNHIPDHERVYINMCRRFGIRAVVD